MLHNGQRFVLGRVGKAGDVSICFPFEKKKKNRDRERETAIIVLTTEKTAPQCNFFVCFLTQLNR